MLLDSALCAISPLLFLTSQVPEMNGCSPKTQVLGFFYFNQHLVSPDGDSAYTNKVVKRMKHLITIEPVLTVT